MLEFILYQFIEINMAYCPSIHHLEMDEESLLALTEIFGHDDLKLKLQFAISGGHWINTFLGNGAVETLYSVHSTDFDMMTKAISATNRITQRIVEDIITTQAIRSDVNTKQLLFWRAMYNGCILKK
ncbi:hypothetical protein HWV03_14735 [Moritella sp. 36]|uniref:hypothetical protein n=1 Tax=Moritella sp. 36 TaxID=2746233 RepID=UPI001BA6ADC3|nr:hypothetical protein [Moritella sp. 36]QUM89970.1 hypothetical protein HWV03_14735 [Moritella sp. 36]